MKNVLILNGQEMPLTKDEAIILRMVLEQPETSKFAFGQCTEYGKAVDTLCQKIEDACGE